LLLRRTALKCQANQAPYGPYQPEKKQALKLLAQEENVSSRLHVDRIRREAGGVGIEHGKQAAGKIVGT
jgi:hypothetical protein